MCSFYIFDPTDRGTNGHVGLMIECLDEGEMDEC